MRHRSSPPHRSSPRRAASHNMNTRGPHANVQALRRRGALTVQQTNSLIDNIKSFPCIWNPDHEEYVNRNTIAGAWAAIAKRVKFPEQLIRVKWKNLRDLFMRESKRTKVTAIEDYRGKWKHFKKLWFLHRATTTERVLSEDDASEHDAYETTRQSDDIKTEAPDTGVREFVFLDTEEEANEILAENLCNDNTKSDHDDISDLFPPPPKLKRVEQTYTMEDCDVMFLVSLSPYFKLLKPIRKLVVRNKIQQLILNEFERTTDNGQL